MSDSTRYFKLKYFNQKSVSNIEFQFIQKIDIPVHSTFGIAQNIRISIKKNCGETEMTRVEFVL